MPDLDLNPLGQVSRLLFTVPLEPLQGDRFQPTGFPSLGAATYQTKNGTRLLVESAQSMANRLEAVCWDSTEKQPVAELKGISHVTVTRKGKFLTDSMLEAHRLNSPYILSGRHGSGNEQFIETFKKALGIDDGLLNSANLSSALLRYDVNSLIHGIFLEKIAGRLRLTRTLSAFIEAEGASVAASGGVKNDHVYPQGNTKAGFGNVPFSRDEYVAESIHLYVNVDLAQIRGYGFSQEVQELLILLALYRVRKLLDGDLRLRTACDLRLVKGGRVVADNLESFPLPDLATLSAAVKPAIEKCKGQMVHSVVTFEDELKGGKAENEAGEDESDSDSDPDE